MAVKRRKGPDIPRMNDVQLLAHLLTMAGLEVTAAREMSHSLLDSYRSLGRVLAQSRDELLRYPGLGEGAATFLLLLPALIERYTGAARKRISLKNRQDVAQLLTPHFYGQSTERVCVFLLGDDFRLITAALVAQGGRDAVSCSVQRVLELALGHRAKGVVLAHNHPDEIPAFSKSDLAATGVLMQELELVGIPLVDHYLVAGEYIISLNHYTRYLQGVDLLLPSSFTWFPSEEQ